MRSKSWVVALALLSVVGCKKDKTSPDVGGQNDRYFIAATAGDATYTLVVDDLEKDTTITTQTPGTIENTISFTQFGYNGTDAVFAINYRQGSPAPGSIFQLNANGQLRKMDEFILQNSFNTIGSFDKYLIAAANGKTLTGDNDGKSGSIFSFIDLQNDNAVSVKSIVTENFIGNRTASFVGIVDAGNGQFLTGITLAAPTGGTAVSTDSVWVAKLDANLNVIKIYDDNRLSYSAGQRQSARYAQIANDASGNTYVFSGSYAASTTKAAGALLIKKGANDFDADYYFNIEEKSGGYRFKRLWHVTEDYFFIEFYNETGAQTATAAAANQFAIVRMSTKEFNWVRTGFPAVSTISSTGWPFTANGKAYVSVVTPDTQPTIYVIDPKTATAKKGISVSGVTSIAGVAKLSPQSHIQ